MRKHLILAATMSVCVLLFIAGPAWSQNAPAHKPEKVIFQTTQFGRAFYDYAFAYEELARKSGSWVELKAEETPGAMFIIKYQYENLDQMRSGKKPWTVTYGSSNGIRFNRNGWEPFNKYPLPGFTVFSSILCRINVLGTFDPNIKSAKDLAGKRVAVAAKAAPFNSTLKYLPYFEKGLNVNVNWQFIGIDQGKDALLNGTVDATVCTFMGEYTLAPDGKTFVITKAAPDSPTLQLLASGRKLHLIPFDPQILMSTYQGEGMEVFNPALLKAGSADGIAADVTGLCEFLYMQCDKDTPDDIIIELLKVRYEQADKFGDYHAMFKMQPKNPFPAGVPKDYIHPAVFKAAKELGFKVIE